MMSRNEAHFFCRFVLASVGYSLGCMALSIPVLWEGYFLLLGCFATMHIGEVLATLKGD